MVRLCFVTSLIFLISFLNPSNAQDYEFYLYINFNEWMDTIGFDDTNNFTWTDGLETIEVSLIDTSTALLKTNLPESNKWYTLEVSNVYDRAGNLIDPDKDTMGSILRFVPLPVELSSFTAKYTNEGVQLKWITKTEVENYGFEIQRNVNETSWMKIGFKAGYGNSNSPKNYSFTDDNLVGGSKFQYRLKQIDTDGEFEYSGVIDIEYEPEEFMLYQNYPNPFNPKTRIKYQLPETSNIIIKVYDISGNEITTLLNIEKQAGTYEVEFDALSSSRKIASGVYFYRLIAVNPEDESEVFFSSSRKMIVLH